ncbi:hypothetical protein [Nonomuraea sp. NPDC049400]|uniref:MmyB family transcriptional regulator n=1 Tax=Nonomuraea sp. NPDC049400 TaxID=3364352 RepID=UPI00379BF745
MVYEADVVVPGELPPRRLAWSHGGDAVAKAQVGLVVRGAAVSCVEDQQAAVVARQLQGRGTRARRKVRSRGRVGRAWVGRGTGVVLGVRPQLCTRDGPGLQHVQRDQYDGERGERGQRRDPEGRRQQRQRALFSEMFAGAVGQANAMRFLFLDPRATRFYADWERAARRLARHSIGALRVETARNLHDRELSNLVGELELAHEVMELSGNDGLTVCTYSADPGSASGDGLKLLESLSAMQR